MYGIISEDESRSIYVFGSHQYALYYWTKAILEKKLNLKAQLVHIDHHADFLTPSYSYNTLVSPEEIADCIKDRKIHYDSFIVPALTIGIIQDVTFCCYPNRHNEIENFINYERPIAIINKLNKYLKGQLLSIEEKLLYSNIVSRNLILDIDSDYFLTADKKDYLIPKRASVIIKEIKAINRLHEFASVTTATSLNIGNSKKGH